MHPCSTWTRSGGSSIGAAEPSWPDSPWAATWPTSSRAASTSTPLRSALSSLPTTAPARSVPTPKKLAAIDVRVRPEAVVGTLARPSDCTLASVIVSPVERLPAEILDAFLPSGTPFYSLRHLPGPPGATQVHELIQWNCDLAVRKDAFGDDLRFTGPGSVTYPARSAVDPVHRLEVDTLVAAAYLEFDMRLTAGKCVWSETVVAATAQEAEPAGTPA